MDSFPYAPGLMSLMYHLVFNKQVRSDFHDDNTEVMKRFSLTAEQQQIFLECGNAQVPDRKFIMAVLESASGEILANYVPTSPPRAYAQPDGVPPYPQQVLSLVYNIMYTSAVKEQFFLGQTEQLVQSFGLQGSDVQTVVATMSQGTLSAQGLLDLQNLICTYLMTPDAGGQTPYNRAW